MTQPVQQITVCAYCLGPLTAPPTWSNNTGIPLGPLAYALHSGTPCGHLVHGPCAQHIRDSVASSAGGCPCGQGSIDGVGAMAVVDVPDSEEEEEEETHDTNGAVHEFLEPSSADGSGAEEEEEDEEEDDDRLTVCAACDGLLALDPQNGTAFSTDDVLYVGHADGAFCGWRMHLDCAIQIQAGIAPNSFRQCHCGNSSQISAQPG
jgi:hypothetical protein